jgi:FKBP-type peptidyl-prolyl cis-trans isomerase
MRRASALILIPLLMAFAVAGCGSSSNSGSSSSSSTTNSSVSVTGKFGSAPSVSIPSEQAGTNLYTKTVIPGTGTKLASTDSFIGNYVAYVWSGSKHKLATSTYTTNPTMFTGTLLPGLKAALNGAAVGSRVLAVIPPKDGFGAAGNSQLGIKGTDTLVFVIDVLQRITPTEGATGSKVSSGGGSLPTVSDAATNPTITIPPKNVKPPTALTVKTLIQGTGPTVADGDYLVVQYTGVNWRTGKVFDSSWQKGQPFGLSLTAGQMINGWVTGLAGQKVGSRVLLVIPPKDGYGSAGQSSAGITGTDTLVFTVDILAAYK